jgi:F-type H+-transporting ATPase subunit b
MGLLFGCSLRPPDATCVHTPVQPYWQEIVIAVIAFGLVCLVLMKLVFPRMERVFAARVDAIEGGLERAAATRAEAEQLLADYRAQVAAVRAEAATIRDAARAEAAGVRDGILAQARTEAERLTAAGRRQLQAERERIRTELEEGIESLAFELAGRILGESLEADLRHDTHRRRSADPV